MKLSTRGKYGLLAVYDLAINDEKPVPIKTIAQRQGISDAYLEQLFASLKKAKLVRSTRGAQGGYQLTRPPAEITIGEILLALEGSLSVTDCVDSPDCGQSCVCPSRPVFHTIQRGIDGILSSLTLADMLEVPADGQDEKNDAKPDDKGAKHGAEAKPLCLEART